MTDDAFDFESPPRSLDVIRRNLLAGSITGSEAVDLAYGAGYYAGRNAEAEFKPTGAIVRVGNNATPEVKT